MDGNFQPSDVIADDFDIRRIALAMAISLASATPSHAAPVKADMVLHFAKEFDGFLRGMVTLEPTP